MSELIKEYIEKITSCLGSGDIVGVRGVIAELHSSEIGGILKGLDEADAVEVFKLLTPEAASDALLEIDERLRKTIIASISSEELIEVVEEMETDDAADIISELHPEDATQVLDGIDSRESIELRKLLVYAEDTAGGKMQAELVSVREGSTVQDAIDEVRRKSKDIEDIACIFVVDNLHRLTGVVSLNKLIIATPPTAIIDIADREPIKVRTDLDQEEVAKIFQRYDLSTMPVVDASGVLVGRITFDDVIDVVEEEIFEDFYKVAGLNLEERVLDSPMRSIWMRAPWLLINLGTAFMAASVVRVFQGTIEKLVVLAVLMPIVAGMGGNAATQTITIVVRGLALGELSLKNTKWILMKEALVGLANGFITGLVAMVVAYVLGANILVGVLLFLAMTLNLVIAGLSGAIIPIVLKWFKTDPAISATVFVTTCTDVGGFFSFLGLAALFMKMGLL